MNAVIDIGSVIARNLAPLAETHAAQEGDTAVPRHAEEPLSGNAPQSDHDDLPHDQDAVPEAPTGEDARLVDAVSDLTDADVPHGSVAGVQDEMLTDEVDTAMLHGGVMGTRQRPETTFDDVTGALEALDKTVHAAIATDQRQAQEELARLRASHPSALGNVSYQVERATTAIQAEAEQALEAVKQVVVDQLEPHAQAPDELEEMAQEADCQVTAITEMVPRVRALAKAEGWEGAAAESYRRSTEVQAKALEEFCGMIASSANALARASLLNRAAFRYASESIKATIRRLQAGPTLPALPLFGGTRRTIAELHALASKLSSDITQIENGIPASELAQELDHVLEMPKVLQRTGWPTGGGAFETPVAQTADGVRREA